MNGAGATINSRIRVLVARTFKAEKLYASMSFPDGVGTGFSLDNVANDLRADAWLRCHKQLRAMLNETLKLSGSSAMVSRLAIIKQQFINKANCEEAKIAEKAKLLMDSATRQEYASCLQFSLELVESKACAQASRVIIDEVSGVLSASGNAGAFAPVFESMEVAQDEVLTSESEKDPKPELPANVVRLQLKKRA